MTKPDFVIHKLDRPRQGELLLTHDIGIDALEKLAQGKRRLSRDGYRKDAAAVYEAIDRPELQSLKFACMTAHIESTFKARSVTALYGRGSNVALIVDISAIRDKLFMVIIP